MREKLNMEIWKPIKDYPDYMVSNLGRVKSLRFGKEKILKTQSDKDGYKKINLFKDKKSNNKKIHRLVAEAFIPNPNNLPCINHKNEIKDDNRLENLEWCSVAYNNIYGTRIEKLKKTILQFSLNGEFIRKWESIKDIETDLGFCHSLISNYLNGKRKTAYGYIWKYYDLELYLESKLFKVFGIKNKKVA